VLGVGSTPELEHAVVFHWVLGRVIIFGSV